MIQCDACGTVFDPVGRRWLCPCGYKASCCEGEPLCDGNVTSVDQRDLTIGSGGIDITSETTTKG